MWMKHFQSEPQPSLTLFIVEKFEKSWTCAIFGCQPLTPNEGQSVEPKYGGEPAHHMSC